MKKAVFVALVKFTAILLVLAALAVKELGTL